MRIGFLFLQSLITLNLFAAVFGEDVPRTYSIVQGYFKQSDPDFDESLPNSDLGLESGKTWSDVIDKVKSLNQDSTGGSKYKLLLLARHGQGWHNVAPSHYPRKEWICKLEGEDGADGIEWYDALLTPTGEDQAKDLGETLTKLESSGFEIPKSYYVSPLRRTLETFSYTWKNIIDINSQRPTVKEMAREVYGIATESKRHNKTYIKEHYPFALFEEGFAEDDELWKPDKEEEDPHVDYRSTLLLNDIFTHDDNEVISVTSHSGLIYSIQRVVNHPHWSMKTGSLLPVIVQASNFGPYVKPDDIDQWSTKPSYCADYNS